MTPTPSDPERIGELEKLREEAIRLTKKYGNPNGTDYEQGTSDHGVRLIGVIDAAIASLAAIVEAGDLGKDKP